ncbi:serine hydrolase family protein [Helicobacter muridarum]|uniref:Hydrolase ydeN n=1 Tax=Helicobacter muridarum TaxID=216 RepID=A0A099U1R3_9HELI|nr:alpha/beta hydrolase [Helicobacter muridarum]TLE01172.1 serine hydrolase family protein [Helicobacter muridarum]STQ86048.1 Putative hydrolase ydeN [Helicobacter muridarum]
MQVYITHGFRAYPQKHWFMWLKEQLSKNGITTFIPAMPNADAPNSEEWLSTMQNIVKKIDESTIFIGHSLGCAAVLNFLSKQPNNIRINAIVLVSGFYELLPIYPQLNSFIQSNFDFGKVCNICSNRLVISARDDSIVPTSLSQTLAKNLQANFIQTQVGGHFMQDDGFREFPLLLHNLKFFL